MPDFESRWPQWWLQNDGAPSGPFAYADVQRRLKDGQLSPETMACPVGTTNWRPLKDWVPFAGQTIRESSFNRQETPPTDGLNSLPDMPKWICIYGLFVSPVLWLANFFSCISSTPMFLPESPWAFVEPIYFTAHFFVSLSVTALLFVGSQQLRRLRRSGPTLLVVGLWTDVIWTIVANAAQRRERFFGPMK